MSANIWYFCSLLAAASPFLAIVAILLFYLLQRTAWRIRRRRGNCSLGFCPSAAALGMVLLFTQVFIRPSLRHVLKQCLEEAPEETVKGGDPNRGDTHLLEQLKRIRRGEPVDEPTLRL